jgi:competence protein ComEA
MKSLKTFIIVAALALWGSAFASEVNINTMDAATIASNLKGIGMAKAQAIVTYREENGPFGSIDELTNVRGIGEKTVAKNRDSILLSETPADQ